jgi:hypothetical protein
MSTTEPKFPKLPGWRFSLTETSFNVYRAEGFHDDGRSVSRMGTDAELADLIRDTVEDARNLPERPKTK